MSRWTADLTRTVLAVLTMGLLIGASFWILRPFLPAIIWATMIVVATWPAMLALQRRLWNSRTLAVTVMTVALLLVFVIPFSMAIGTIAGNIDDIALFARKLFELRLPQAPDWLRNLPVVGASLATSWDGLAGERITDFGNHLKPYTGAFARWFVAEVGGVGALLLQFLLTVLVAAVLYASGEKGARQVVAFGWRVGGERGADAVQLAAKAIRSVALGVVGTALIQSLLGGVGFAVAGVPYPGVLTAVMFMLALAQIGAVPILLGGVGWLYYQGDTVWMLALAAWTLVVGTMDNFVRPLLIKRGVDLPLMLILVGVIGGLVAFGLVGIFIGPVVLAVTYTLLDHWIHEGSPPHGQGERSPRAPLDDVAGRA
jgi:predicted PurR-regulated permease PerM